MITVFSFGLILNLFACSKSCLLLTIMRSFHFALIRSIIIQSSFFHFGQGSLKVQPPILYSILYSVFRIKHFETKEPINPALELKRNSVSGLNFLDAFLSSKDARISERGLISLFRYFNLSVFISSFSSRSRRSYLLPKLGPAATSISYLVLSKRVTSVCKNLWAPPNSDCVITNKILFLRLSCVDSE